MNALHRIRAALVPDGLLVDTQPVSAHPPVRLADVELGTLNMREWAATIDEVDRETELAVDDGLFRLEHQRSFIVTDAYDDGPDLIQYVQDWQGTEIPPALARTLHEVSAPVSLDQEIRLRLYRTLA